MSLPARLCIVAAALLLPSAAMAQSASPTLPSDTLEANYAPRSVPGPSPELAPSLPSDTLDAGAPMEVPDSGFEEVPRDSSEEEEGSPWQAEPHQEALRVRLG
jgi:hypothetical protein